MSGFALYSGLIGDLLAEQACQGPGNLYLFTFALGLHLVVNDYALHAHHRDRYRRVGRWVLSAAVLAGAGIGLTLAVPPVPVSIVLAFLAGGRGAERPEGRAACGTREQLRRLCSRCCRVRGPAGCVG